MVNLVKKIKSLGNYKLVDKLLAEWPQQFASNLSYAIGLSGGIDSVVLLHILSQTKIKLNAIHIDHGISECSGKWAEFCSDLCKSLNVPLHISQHKISKSGGESLENNARQVRYQIFLQNSADVIILAHHENDQVETTLSQIFRGSNLHNIAGMHTLSQKQNKLFWRPLLNIPKSVIETYAKEFLLEYIVDESNFDTKFLRNFIRQDILPCLIKWDKNISTKILNFNQEIKEQVELADEIAKEDLNNTAEPWQQNKVNAKFAINSSSPIHPCINLIKFKILSQIRQMNLVNYFISKQNFPLPSHKQINEFINQAVTSKFDKMPQLKLDNRHEIVKYKNQIFIRFINS